MMKKQMKDILTNAPKKREITIESALDQKEVRYPGDSVDRYKDLEEANLLISEDEIKQQNENL